ncbi:MAG: hypothetical protein RBT46_06500 [Weeksellaceae bacterium]|jgi:hypothetical protein|nr:hypothetical protein [Weeksellaceae bacterium]MDX9705340.1 hypothetical protein [Weeksellaceae bacterium]
MKTLLIIFALFSASSALSQSKIKKNELLVATGFGISTVTLNEKKLMPI